MKSSGSPRFQQPSTPPAPHNHVKLSHRTPPSAPMFLKKNSGGAEIPLSPRKKFGSGGGALPNSPRKPPTFNKPRVASQQSKPQMSKKDMKAAFAAKLRAAKKR